jgi:outer membrane protein W
MVRFKYIIIVLMIANLSFAIGTQINPKPELKTKEPRNNFGLSVLYSDKGYGLSGGFFKPISNSSDLFINLSVTGISDNREFEYFDYYGNSYVEGKINRIFMVPLNIGLQHYMFKDEIENDFKPLFSIGVTPALVVINPFDRGYFNAFAYSHAAFAFGPFVGAGLEFEQSKNMAFTLNLRYYYLPVINGSVMSIKNSEMKDLGGITLNFGVNFLK